MRQHTHRRHGARPGHGWTSRLGNRLLGWIGWFLLCCAGIWPTTTAAQAQRQSAEPSPLLRDFWATPLPAGASGNYAWPRAAQALGRTADEHHLRLGLMVQWLQALEGRTDPANPTSTVADTIALGRTAQIEDLNHRATLLWHQRIAPAWQPVWLPTGTAVPLPIEIEAIANELQEQGPGLWLARAPNGAARGLYWWLGMRHSLPQPLPLPQFTVRVGPPLDLAFDCQMPRYTTRMAVPPGATQHYLCRSQNLPAAAPPAGWAWPQALEQGLQRSGPISAALPLDDSGLLRTARALESLPNPDVDDFIRRKRECGWGENCHSAAYAAKAAAAQKIQASARTETPPGQYPLWVQRLMLLAAVVGALLLYGLVAQRAGVGVASALLWVALAIPCGIFIRGLWSTNWADLWGGIVVIPLSLAAIGAPFIGTSVAYRVYQFVVNAEARRDELRNAAWRLGLLVLLVLLGLVHRLFA